MVVGNTTAVASVDTCTVSPMNIVLPAGIVDTVAPVASVQQEHQGWPHTTKSCSPQKNLTVTSRETISKPSQKAKLGKKKRKNKNVLITENKLLRTADYGATE